MTTKVWNLMYAVGSTGRIVGDAENPQRRASALEGAATVEKNGWRVWVEHFSSGKRIFESELEKSHNAATSAHCGFEWGRIRGHIALPADVVASAESLAKSYYHEAEAADFTGDPVEDMLLPQWMGPREEWFPHDQLRELGFKIDMLEMEQLLLTVGVDSHTDSIHGPVFILVFHNDGMTFKQGRISHKTKVGEWFVFDDRKPHAVRETARSTAFVCWSVPLIDLMS